MQDFNRGRSLQTQVVSKIDFCKSATSQQALQSIIAELLSFSVSLFCHCSHSPPSGKRYQLGLLGGKFRLYQLFCPHQLLSQLEEMSSRLDFVQFAVSSRQPGVAELNQHVGLNRDRGEKPKSEKSNRPRDADAR